MSVDYNTQNLINICFQELRNNQITNKVYKDYYENNVDSIMSDYAMQDARSNLKIATNFAKKFVQMEVGYSLGNPVTYISKSNNKPLIDAIDFNIGGWSKAQDQRLRKESEIYGVAYELDYINKQGELSATTLNPLNCYVVTDNTPEQNVVMALHYFQIQYDAKDVNYYEIPKEYLDVYIGNRIIHYNCTGGSLIYMNEDTHIFDHVPVIVCPANDEMQSGFHDIIELMKAYNNTNSDEINEINDFRNAYLLITGGEIESDDLLDMKKKGIINPPDADAKVEWLIKKLDNSFIKDALDNLENKIYDIMNETNLNKDFTSNTSSLAIKIKLTNLENKLASIEALFEQTLRKRLMNLSNYLQVKTGKGFDVRDLKIQFTRNLPSDLTSLAQVITQLNPVVSQKTLLSLLPFVNNVDAEIAQFKKEKAENGINLDNVPGGGGVA